MRKYWLLVPIAALLCFIWGNSMMTGTASAAVSGGLLSRLLEQFPFLYWLPENLLRKMGHFSEFGLLGILWAGFFLDQRGYHRFSMPLLCCMLAGTIDETIQTMVPDRGPNVLDVWIDTAGASLGIAAVLLGYTVYTHRKGKRK